MGDVIDFTKYKLCKENGNTLENNYIKFLTYVNKLVGIPTSFEKASEVMYYILRYLDGTINCLSMLEFFNLSASRQDMEGFKKHTIAWLESIIDSIKNL